MVCQQLLVQLHTAAGAAALPAAKQLSLILRHGWGHLGAWRQYICVTATAGANRHTPGSTGMDGGSLQQQESSSTGSCLSSTHNAFGACYYSKAPQLMCRHDALPLTRLLLLLLPAVINEVRVRGESCGGVVTCVVRSCPKGLGNPVFDKLEAELAKAMLSLPATKVRVLLRVSEMLRVADNSNNNTSYQSMQHYEMC
jgi:hypothetical protein